MPLIKANLNEDSKKADSPAFISRDLANALMCTSDTINQNVLSLKTYMDRHDKRQRIEFALNHVNDFHLKYYQKGSRCHMDQLLKNILYNFRMEDGYYIEGNWAMRKLSSYNDESEICCKEFRDLLVETLYKLLGVKPRLVRDDKDVSRFIIYFS